MKDDELYNEFKNNITNKKLKAKLDSYEDRLEEVYTDKKTRDGILIGSKVREIAQRILFETGTTYIWLSPLETSIDEYSSINFTAKNQYANKSYSLVQSPQIQKEAAATVLGSNFRIIDCYRGEKTDSTHSNIFQQIDVEFANQSEKQIRGVAQKIIETCFSEIAGISLKVDSIYSYENLKKLYGTDTPNLKNGFWIQQDEKIYNIKLDNQDVINQIMPYVSKIQECKILGNRIVFANKCPIEVVRATRDELIKLVNKSKNKDSKVFGYWVTDMPYAEKKEKRIVPTHHIMSNPKNSEKDDFSFLKLTDDELCNLKCNSFDLLVCTDDRVVEVLGGDERINTFKTQYEAIKRLGYSPEQYAFLLQTLRFNDKHAKKRLGGFAIGVDRLSQFLSKTNNMKYVQLFPTNLPDGELTNALSIEDMEEQR